MATQKTKSASESVAALCSALVGSATHFAGRRDMRAIDFTRAFVDLITAANVKVLAPGSSGD